MGPAEGSPHCQPSDPSPDRRELNEYLSLYEDRMRDLHTLLLSNDEGTMETPATSSVEADQQRAAIAAAFASGDELPPLAMLYVQLMISPLRKLYSWAVPTATALDAIKSISAQRGVLELGAGTGYWAHLLRQRGVDVVACDLHSSDSPHLNGHHAVSDPGDEGGASAVNAPTFGEVLEGLPQDMVPAHSDRVLLLCWPPQEGEAGAPPHVSLMAASALHLYRGDTLVYVGDHRAEARAGPMEDSAATEPLDGPDGAAADSVSSREGSTGGPVFHSMLESDWTLQRVVELPTWPGQRDRLTVWSRRGRGAGEPEPTAALPPAPSPTHPHLGAGFRQALLASHREAWEDLATVNLMHRKATGSGGVRGAAERAAVEAVKSRSGIFRRLLLKLVLR